MAGALFPSGSAPALIYYLPFTENGAASSDITHNVQPNDWTAYNVVQLRRNL